MKKILLVLILNIISTAVIADIKYRAIAYNIWTGVSWSGSWTAWLFVDKNTAIDAACKREGEVADFPGVYYDEVEDNCIWPGSNRSGLPGTSYSVQEKNCGIDIVQPDGTCNPRLFVEQESFTPVNTKSSGFCLTDKSNYPTPTINVGNPINTTNGNKIRKENDYTSTGISPLTFTRFYSSNKNKITNVGVNWRHSYTASLTANIHTIATPYVEGDPKFSILYSTHQLACESGWDNIKANYNDATFATSTATYVNSTSTCNIQDTNGNALGSIALRDEPSGGVSPNPPQDTIVIERANGNTIVFTPVNSVWTAPSDTDVSLIETTTGYTLTTAQDTIEEYNFSGQLISTTDRNGIQQTLIYNATTGLLESVTDSLGKSLTFGYTGTNLTTVTLPDSTQLTYTYDAYTNFSSVKREDISTKTYVYEDARFPNALTGIIDENNQRYMTFSYDAQGRAVTSELAGGSEKVTVNFIDDVTSTVTDALGQLRTYRFTTINGEKRLTDLEGGECGSCGGNATHTTYDANGYVDSSTDFNGNITTYTNNTRGLATTRVEAVGTQNERTTSYEWHPNYSLPTCIIEEAKTTSLSYLPNGSLETRTAIDTSDTTLFVTPESKVCTAIEARGDFSSLNKRSISYTYYPNYGLVKTIDGARTDINDITSFTYDAVGNLATITNALGQVTQLNNYTVRGRPQEIINANGLVTTLTYDVRGRIDIVKVGNLVTDYDFDAIGQLDKVTRPDGSFIDYGYDAAQRLTDIRDQTGSHIHYTLDALGNRKATDVKDANGTLKRTSTAIYNQLGQLEKTIGAALQTTDYLLYDNNGNLKHLKDADGNNSWLGYDALNRLETTTNELNDVSTTVYDTQDNITSVTDFKGLVTSYRFDGLNNRTELNSPDTGITQYTSHDGVGNVLSMVDAQNQTTTYTYDALNRIDFITYNDGSTTDYVYDLGVNAIGRLSSIAYADAANTKTITSAWTYDIYGRVDSKTETINGKALTTTYNYNPTTGQLDNIVTSGGRTISYAYLNAQVSSMSVDNKNIMSAITYDPFASANAWVWGNGATSNRTYDLDGQLATYNLGNSTYNVGYTTSGNIQTLTDLANITKNQTFNYDGLHRLKDHTGSTGNEVYDYDAGSNRIGLTDVTSSLIDTYVVDPLSNKLMSVTGTTNKSYSYNAIGNITSDGKNIFGYDARNRLSVVSYPQECLAGEEAICNSRTDEATYQFNALGQRVLKTTLSKGPDYVALSNHYQQQVDSAQLLITRYSEESLLLLAQAQDNEEQATLLTSQAESNRVQADSLIQNADAIAIDQQNIQALATELYTAAESYQSLIIEPTTSYYQSLLNDFYQAVVDLIIVIADAVQDYVNNLALQEADLRAQANTLLTSAITDEQKAALFVTDAQQLNTDAANLQTLAQEQTNIAGTAQIKVDTYSTLALSQPKKKEQILFMYDESGQLTGEYDASGNAIREMVYFGNTPVGIISHNASNATPLTLHYIHTDHLGTPRVITDENNSTLWSWHSDPFGKTLPNEDVDGDGVSFKFNLRFAGQYYDTETGLHYNYFRDYDPSTGRYVQSDPIGLEGGLNTYGYVDGNPLYWIDPYGLEKNYQAQRGWSSVYPPHFNTQKTPFPKKPETIAEAVVQYGPYVIGGVAGLSLKQGVKQCAKKLADNKDLCKNAALAGFLGISMCQQGKVPKGIGRINKHIEFVTKTTKPLRQPRESIVQPNK